MQSSAELRFHIQPSPNGVQRPTHPQRVAALGHDDTELLVHIHREALLAFGYGADPHVLVAMLAECINAVGDTNQRRLAANLIVGGVGVTVNGFQATLEEARYASLVTRDDASVVADALAPPGLWTPSPPPV